MNTADDCRKRGLQVGDTIEGRSEGPGSWWHEARLTLLWLGESVAVWRVQTRNIDRQVWDRARESAQWSLTHRRWKKATE